MWYPTQEPTVPQEYILKGVVNAAVGQENGSREHLKIAQQYFQVGAVWQNGKAPFSPHTRGRTHKKFLV